MTYRRALHFAGYRAESFGDIFLLLRAVDEAVARGNFALDASDAADSLGSGADFIGKLDVGGIVGRDGTLTVSRDIGLNEPYVGSTELVSGEIAEDLTAYLLESEQVPSACALGVLVDTDKSIKAAGGFIVQLMPGAPEEYIDRLEENIFMMDQVTTVLDEDGAEALFGQVLKGFEHHVVSTEPIEYRCYCSRERVEAALASIGSDALAELAQDGKDISVGCQFCGTKYTFSPAELEAIQPKPAEE